MHSSILLLLSLALGANSYPWAAELGGNDVESLVEEHRRSLDVRSATCPTHLTRKGAAPYSNLYPSAYTGAKNGLPGTGKGGVLVPAAGDTAHKFVAPSSTDIRGPCPALNMASNHNFLSHEGLTNYTELVDMAQNVFNWGWDLANFVATFGIVMDGDPVTESLSIGCKGGEAIPNTGLNTHDKFETDASMARTDFYLSPTGNSYSVNATLFGYMNEYCNGNFTLACMGPYMGSRYNQSKSTNGNFFYGPLGLFALGTATLPQESFASLGNQGHPTLSTIAPFWAVSQTAPGTGTFTAHPGHERIPPHWYNRPSALSFAEILAETSALYAAAGYPAFGGNTGAPGEFVGLTFEAGGIEGGVLGNATAAGLACLFWQVVTDALPTSLEDVLALPAAATVFAEAKLGASFEQFGCPSL